MCFCEEHQKIKFNGTHEVMYTGIIARPMLNSWSSMTRKYIRTWTVASSETISKH